MSRRSVLRLAILPALAAAGCAYTREFRCPAEGGPQWVEVESAHFRVVTDAPPAEAHRLAGQYEQVRQAMLAGAWDWLHDPPGRLEVVVLRNRFELGELTGQTWDRPVFEFLAGYFQPWERPRIVTGLLHDREAPSLALPPFREAIANEARAEESPILEHELAHYLTFHALLRQPQWLAEGLALYLETTAIGTWQGKPAAAIGLPPKRGRTSDRPLPAASLLQGEAFNYFSSGLLVHWLVNQRGRQFADYQQRLARAEDPAAAWKASFPDLDPAEDDAMIGLDRALVEYGRVGGYVVRRVMLPALPSSSRERTLAPAEVHALRSELFLTAGADRIERARAELAESLREDPSGLAALVPLFFLRPGDELLAMGQKAVKERPDDWRGGLLVALGASERPDLAAERLAGLRAVARAMPDDPIALFAGAWELRRLGASGDALPLAARAAALAPWSVAALDTYGTVLADLGRCGEALGAQRRAVDLLPRTRGRVDGEAGVAARVGLVRAAPGPLRTTAGEVREHLREIEQGCHPPSAQR
jgi:tetratricopeptide (TPR) repeat protein